MERNTWINEILCGYQELRKKTLKPWIGKKKDIAQRIDSLKWKKQTRKLEMK
jgi:hypothetical protein